LLFIRIQNLEMIIFKPLSCRELYYAKVKIMAYLMVLVAKYFEDFKAN